MSEHSIYVVTYPFDMYWSFTSLVSRVAQGQPFARAGKGDFDKDG